MKAYTVDLKQEYPFLQGGKLDCLLSGDPSEQGEPWSRPAVIIVPGGAYEIVCPLEGEPVAHRFLAKGFHTFVLTYLCRCDGVCYPEQLLELSSAVDYIRKHAKQLHVNADEIFAVGFSAGGHLVANLAVEYGSVAEKAGYSLDAKPAAVGLSYPVITSVHGHQGSYDALLNGYTDEAKAELLKTLNLNEAVTEQTAPAFIWTTAEDTCVPADNSIRFALALAQHGVGYELHVYPKGDHGLSTGDREVCYTHSPEAYSKRICEWPERCAEFFRLYTKQDY
ncbi:MAG: alpha/beta hydrolase [Clostridia bacterium]|nr:alpha/beta hydrolase [Clostridia bacterium]